MKQEIAKREWKTHFGDEREFLDKYFSTYYSPENLIINTDNLDDDFIYMSLIVRYSYKYFSDIIPIAYVTAVLTNPEFRNKGYFRIAMQKVFESMISQDYILSCLIPATDELTQTYLRYGYSNCFIDEQNADSHKSIVHHEKTITLYKELGYNLSLLMPNRNGMIRIINVEKVIEIYARYNPEITKTYKIIDSQISNNNNKVIEICSGKSTLVTKSNDFQEIIISDLASQIFNDSYMDKMFDQ
ncbi:MAG: GNAT family N-acetyltransferase [Bacteroidales bacterium]